ncbi:NUDIX domain-containing protein [Halobium salinum]|uniref:NUDIX domain-containing protein n=1 Tax=Halobium salinum TaxID=1364940 RepID=A0ABD5P9T4_9EURY|nr:NUDIX domain-containing protein [Halobium salinum]
MVNRPPEFCPYCGEALSPVDPPTTHYCAACDDAVFYNPIPTTRLAVLDGESILLVKVDSPDADLWGTPGGMVEAGENPDEAGARELKEETTLTVNPDDLVLFDVRSFAKFGTTHKTVLAYAVDVTDVRGTPKADNEVAAARFWSASELARVEDRLLTSWPTAYKDVGWWVENARAALE